MFHTPCVDLDRSVEVLEYTCLLKNTFTPECLLWKNISVGVAYVECHMHPNISKTTTDKERVVTACAASQSISRGPNRTRFLTVQTVIRAKTQCDKKSFLTVEDASKKTSACEHCWPIEGWIHSKRRNKLHQKLVEKLVCAHTNLVLRESLDDVLHHLLPWDIDLVIDETVDESEEEPEV